MSCLPSYEKELQPKTSAMTVWIRAEWYVLHSVFALRELDLQWLTLFVQCPCETRKAPAFCLLVWSAFRAVHYLRALLGVVVAPNQGHACARIIRFLIKSLTTQPMSC